MLDFMSMYPGIGGAMVEMATRERDQLRRQGMAMALGALMSGIDLDSDEAPAPISDYDSIDELLPDLAQAIADQIATTY